MRTIFLRLGIILTLIGTAVILGCSNGKTELELNAEFLYKKMLEYFHTNR